jgi:hypothetical protein
LSIRVIARLFDHDYHTIHDAVDDFEIAFIVGFPRVWETIKPCVGGPTQVDETPQVCSGFTGQEPPREGLDHKVIYRLIAELIPTVPHEPVQGYFICSVNTGDMVNLVSVGEFTLDEGALHAAVDTHLDLKSVDQEQRNRTREVLNSGHSWLNQRDLTADTVSEYMSELREATGDDHPILSGEDFDNLEEKVADDAGNLVEDLIELFEDESSLEDRIERFRTNQGIELSVISVLLATFDPDRYVLSVLHERRNQLN